MAYRYYDFKNKKQTKSESVMIHNHDISIRHKLSDIDSNNMVKHLRHNKNGNKKFSHNPSLLSTGDQELNDKLRYNGSKTPVYVHNFKTNSNVKHDNGMMITNSNIYTHSFQDYLNGKSTFLKSKFDSLTLVNKNYSTNLNYNQNHLQNSQRHLQENNKYHSNLNVRNSKQEPIQKRSKVKNKSGLNETVINQLEESYWANWRPNKKGAVKSHIKKSLDKVYSERTQQTRDFNQHQINTKKNSATTNVKKNTPKKLAPPRPPVSRKISSSSVIVQEEPVVATEMINVVSEITAEMENLEIPSEIVPEKPVQFIHEPTENSHNMDSNCSEEFNLIIDDDKKEDSIESISSVLKSIDLQRDTTTLSSASLDEVSNKTKVADGSSQNSMPIINKDLRNIEEQLSKSVQPHLVAVSTCTSDQEVHTLKHTDSFIITSRKQNIEKPHYPQPKCIKLQRNPNLVNRSHNYIKGGSYPLKSCLKKEKLSSQSLILGKPGSPMLLNPNKNKTTRKYT